jgi:hypothetical protein
MAYRKIEQYGLGDDGAIWLRGRPNNMAWEFAEQVYLGDDRAIWLRG